MSSPHQFRMERPIRFRIGPPDGRTAALRKLLSPPQPRRRWAIWRRFLRRQLA
jgi:hypothetical protein